MGMTARDCYALALTTAEHYQALISQLPTDTEFHRERDVLTAKRDAASDIALEIKSRLDEEAAAADPRR